MYMSVCLSVCLFVLFIVDCGSYNNCGKREETSGIQVVEWRRYESEVQDRVERTYPWPDFPHGEMELSQVSQVVATKDNVIQNVLDSTTAESKPKYMIGA